MSPKTSQIKTEVFSTLFFPILIFSFPVIVKLLRSKKLIFNNFYETSLWWQNMNGIVKFRVQLYLKKKFLFRSQFQSEVSIIIEWENFKIVSNVWLRKFRRKKFKKTFTGARLPAFFLEFKSVLDSEKKQHREGLSENIEKFSSFFSFR